MNVSGQIGPPSRTGLGRAWAVLATGLWIAGGAAAAPPGDVGDDPTAGFAPRHREWLEEVAVLLTDEERAAFLALEREIRRDAFIERFWAERDPFPDTGQNEFLLIWRERVRMARERFRSLEGDRAEVLLLAGPPDRVEPGDCPQLLREYEIWHWQGSGMPGPARLLFVRDAGDFRLWSPLEGLGSLLERDDPFAAGQTGLRERLARECPRGRQLELELDRLDDWRRLGRQMERVPRPSPEWAATFLERTTEVPAAAATFAAELDVTFTGRHQSRTVVEALVSVPRAEIEMVRGFASLVVDGEIERDGRLFDQFRYRFETPVTRLAGERLPLVVERYLRPGRYRLALRVRDEGSERYFRAERELEVPRWRPPRETEPALAAIGGETVDGVAADPGLALPSTAADRPSRPRTVPSRIELVPPPSRLLTGRVRFEALAAGSDLAKVAFLLNGQQVMAKRRPPYSVELDLGHAPRIHRLEAIGYDAGGRAVARDEIPLNIGPHRFAVRMIEPETGSRHTGQVRARVDVDLPRGARLERLELYLDQQLLATLYQEPFAQRVPLPAEGGVSYIRAVAYLPDGHSTEDLVVINSPEIQDRVDVDFVELYATVVDRKGRPAEGLAAEDFRVVEEGVPQRILRFERASDLPIHAGVLIDTSISMAEEIEEVRRAALRFFERVLEPRDRAAVFVFSDEPKLQVPLTGDLEVLAGGLAGLEADGETALYDCLVEGLFYFAGVRGKRALVLLSDGEDSASRHSFDEVLDFARRSGTAIYTVALATRDFEIRSLLRRLAHETGGETFLIDRVSQLDSVYERIEEELRSQYLIGYQSTRLEGDEFREVTIEVAVAGLEARAAPGYYP